MLGFHARIFLLMASNMCIIDSLLIDLYAPAGRDAIKLLYFDSDILVFNKPPNMNTAPGVVDSMSLAQHAADLFHMQRVDHMIAHRLDYGTSGVVVFARNVEALTALHKQFRLKHNVYKKYCALVHGSPSAWEGEIDLPINRDKIRGSPYFAVDTETGKPSLTYWSMLCKSKSESLIQLRPITGRTHQLRIHLHAIGIPIRGDKFYNSPATLQFDNNQDPGRLLLHAETLGFLHPRTLVPIQFVAACGDSFEPQ
jgi:RluA family pseudouridine synthase